MEVYSWEHHLEMGHFPLQHVSSPEGQLSLKMAIEIVDFPIKNGGSFQGATAWPCHEGATGASASAAGAGESWAHCDGRCHRLWSRSKNTKGWRKIDGSYGDGSKPWYLVNPKIAGKWMFIPLEMVLIGIVLIHTHIPNLDLNLGMDQHLLSMILLLNYTCYLREETAEARVCWRRITHHPAACRKKTWRLGRWAHHHWKFGNQIAGA